MNDNSKIQLVGGLRIGNPDDESFYDNLLVRLPKDVKNTGNITRFVAFDYLTDNGLLSSEITSFRMPTMWFGWEGNMDCSVMRVAVQSGGVLEP